MDTHTSIDYIFETYKVDRVMSLTPDKIRLVDVKKEPRFTESKWTDAKLDKTLIANVQAQGKDGKVLEVQTKVQKSVLNEVKETDSVCAPTDQGRL
jgi:hypothetical protein